MARFAQFGERWARRSRRFVAVDFDSRRVRVVSARRAGTRADILKCHSVEVPADLSVSDPAVFGPFLHKALKKLHLAGRPVLMSVPRSQAVIKPLSLPAGTPEAEVAAMVHFQVDKELPFRVEDAVVDHILGGGHYGGADGHASADGVNVLVAAVRLPTVDYYRRLTESGQFRLLRLGLRPSAAACCVRACNEAGPGAGDTNDGEHNASVAVVHVGFDEIEISVLQGGSLSFTRSVNVKSTPPLASSRPADTLPPIPLVGANVTSATAASASPEASSPPPAVSPGPSVVMAAPEIARTLQSFQALQRHGQIVTVLVAGETGIEDELVDALTARLKTTCRRLSTGALVRKGTPPDDAMAAALGLALGHASGEFEFDFLDPRRPVVVRDAKQTKLAVGVAAGFLLVAGLLAANYMFLEGKDDQLRAASESVLKLKKQDEELKKIAAQATAVENWARGRQDWLAHWAFLSDLLPDAKSVYLQNLSVTPASNVQAKLKGTKDEPVATLSFTLRARDREIITDITSLMQDAYGHTPSGIDPCDDQFGYMHQTRFSLTVPQDMIRLVPPPMSEIPYTYRPEDDGSAETFGRKGASMRNPAPAAVNPNASAPAAAPSSFREVRFDDVRRDTELLKQLSAEPAPLALMGRLVAEANPKAFVPSASSATHLTFRLEENRGQRGGRGGGSGRFVYVYVLKDSAAAKEIQRRGEYGVQRVRVEGVAYVTGEHPEACPVGLLAERIR